MDLLKESFIKHETVVNKVNLEAQRRAISETKLPESKDVLTLIGNNKLIASHNQKTNNIYFTVMSEGKYATVTAYNSPGIDLPV